MAEEIMREFQKAEEITQNKILYQLFNKGKVDLHTEIRKPLNMTAIETMEKGLRKDFSLSKKLLKIWCSKFKINMVAFERKRSKEIVEAVKSQKETEEEANLKRYLLGR